MRKAFFTGLAILLPFVITCVLILFLIDFFTTPFQNSVEAFFRYLRLFEKPLWIFSPSSLLHFSSKLVSLLLTVGVVLLIGFLGHWVLVHTIFKYGDRALRRIPLVNKIYSPLHEVIKIMFKQRRQNAFTNIVLVPFPTRDSLCFGFITSPIQHGPADQVTVLLPQTPNPTIGFLLTYRYDELIFLDMKAGKAFKFLLSCGILPSSFIVVQKNHRSTEDRSVAQAKAYATDLSLQFVYHSSTRLTVNGINVQFCPVTDNAAKLQCICDLVKKHFLAGNRILINVASTEAAGYIDKLLWRIPEESFIPHNISQVATKERVVITTAPMNVNDAEICINLNTDPPACATAFHTIYELYDKTSPEREALSQKRQAAYQRMKAEL